MGDAGAYRVGSYDAGGASRPPTGSSGEWIDRMQGQQQRRYQQLSATCDQQQRQHYRNLQQQQEQQQQEQQQQQQHPCTPASAVSSPERLSPASNARQPPDVDTASPATKREFGSKNTVHSGRDFRNAEPTHCSQSQSQSQPQPPPHTPHAAVLNPLSDLDAAPSDARTPTGTVNQSLPSYLLPKTGGEKAAKRSPPHNPSKLHSATTAAQKSAGKSLLQFDIDRASIHRSIRPGANVTTQAKVRGAEVSGAVRVKGGGWEGEQEIVQEFGDIAFEERFGAGGGVGLLLFEEKSRVDKA